ncbi:hypothetical protein ACGYLM_07330 [Sulfitobacter sp. 1A10445]|uniref:hypothetical protein n=1 Tax=unclassified Sulfitobacter TaxID=196795 RepID=UPI003744E3B1
MNIKTGFEASTNRPPENALRVEKWSDMPKGTSPARYEIIAEDGATKTISLAKGNRIILDALIQQPVYCASPVRISDRVCILRRDYGVPITKEMYPNDTATDRAKFGVYFLGKGVRRIDGGAA